MTALMSVSECMLACMLTVNILTLLELFSASVCLYAQGFV